MKYIFWILILFSSVAFAQDIPDKSFLSKSKRIQPQYHFNIGSSYSFMPSFGGGMNMYVSPSFSLPLSKKVFMEGGIIASTSVLPGISLYESNFQMRNFNSLAIYGSAFYQITPGFTVYGSGIRQIINTRVPVSYFPMNRNSYSIGSSLKLGPNITIGASIHMFENNNFFSPIPYSPARLNSNPFNW